jgi:hypothetical protein
MQNSLYFRPIENNKYMDLSGVNNGWFQKLKFWQIC